MKFVTRNSINVPEEWKNGDSFSKSLASFMKDEDFLLTKDLNERTISHKLAEYIQNDFSDYYVDCEYNRMEKSVDDKTYVTKELCLDDEDVKSNDDKGKTVFPDIIVHKRGDNDNNEIVIEIKKKQYADEKRKGSDETNKAFDYRKLKAYTDREKLKYKWGAYIEFDGNSISELTYFKNGKEIEEELE